MDQVFRLLVFVVFKIAESAGLQIQRSPVVQTELIRFSAAARLADCVSRGFL